MGPGKRARILDFHNVFTGLERYAWKGQACLPQYLQQFVAVQSHPGCAISRDKLFSQIDACELLTAHRVHEDDLPRKVPYL